MAAEAVYRETDSGPVTEGLTVRWHNKLVKAGSAEGGFDAEILEGIDRLVFQESNLAAVGVTLKRRGLVDVDYMGVTAKFRLEAEEPQDGPENVYWVVSRL